MRIVELNNVLDLTTRETKYSMTVITDAEQLLVVPIAEITFKMLIGSGPEVVVGPPPREIPAVLVELGNQLGINVHELSDEELTRFASYVQQASETTEEPPKAPEARSAQQATVLQIAERVQAPPKAPKPPTDDLLQDEDGVESV